MAAAPLNCILPCPCIVLHRGSSLRWPIITEYTDVRGIGQRIFVFTRPLHAAAVAVTAGNHSAKGPVHRESHGPLKADPLVPAVSHVTGVAIRRGSGSFARGRLISSRHQLLDAALPGCPGLSGVSQARILLSSFQAPGTALQACPDDLRQKVFPVLHPFPAAAHIRAASLDTGCRANGVPKMIIGQPNANHLLSKDL